LSQRTAPALAFAIWESRLRPHALYISLHIDNSSLSAVGQKWKIESGSYRTFGTGAEKLQDWAAYEMRRSRSSPHFTLLVFVRGISSICTTRSGVRSGGWHEVAGSDEFDVGHGRLWK